jgi:hypothetical protein
VPHRSSPAAASSMFVLWRSLRPLVGSWRADGSSTGPSLKSCHELADVGALRPAVGRSGRSAELSPAPLAVTGSIFEPCRVVALLVDSAPGRGSTSGPTVIPSRTRTPPGRRTPAYPRTRCVLWAITHANPATAVLIGIRPFLFAALSGVCRRAGCTTTRAGTQTLGRRLSPG